MSNKDDIDFEMFDDDDAEAVLLKEVAQDGDGMTFEAVEEDAEFQKIAALFQKENEDYELEL